MKKLRIHLTLIVALSMLNIAAVGDDIFDDICKSFQSAEVTSYSKYLGNNVELTIDNREVIYSRSQAELILKDFFAKNPPKTIALTHKSSSGGSRSFAIATYTSSNGNTYRVTIVTNSQSLIQELKFEKS